MDNKEQLDIRITERPDSVSFDELYELLDRAHEPNRQNDVKVYLGAENGEELRRYIGDESVCFVALDGDLPVGTVTLKPVTRSKWYSRKYRLSLIKLLGVLPEYSGRGIGSALLETAEKRAQSFGSDGILLAVSEGNPAMDFYVDRGYKEVNRVLSKTKTHHLIHMIKSTGKKRMNRTVQKTYYAYRRVFTTLKTGRTL